MVRSVSRSKGCARCLQRKVKCDEKLPQCSQCQPTRPRKLSDWWIASPVSLFTITRGIFVISKPKIVSIRI
ncbi:hypothetical protein TsFJ059_006851 [Trichoderma semiorbis]|uniref:Zn(2)-C6 fungal-type domain-containing protein n=1 Tax=Trichoderma semiorbis TaxID=1491008 RepID=A0A9P8HGB9_9HYPO|nr:hypothetical protein TsFJ059_006851 [Trichoderma semiorbis]